MATRRARTGRGWDAAPPRRTAPSTADGAGPGDDGGNGAGDGADGGSWGNGGRRRGGGRAGGAGRFGSRTARADTPPAPPVEPAERARQICLRQLAIRPRTRAELSAALVRYEIDPDVIAEVLDRYTDVGIIDDEAFARAWVTSRHHGRGLARRALAGELRRKGVDPDTIGTAMDEVDGDTEEATARALVQRKLRGSGTADPQAQFRRLVSMLARKGYQPGLAIKVVKDSLAERDSEGALGDIDVDALADHLGEPADQ